MRVTILGSGGAVSTPRVTCSCSMCEEARVRGVPYSRSGPSVYVHGPELLIDTPEETKAQLNRERIPNVPHCTYSHWHPDHVLGRRVWEMNLDHVTWPPRNRPATKIFLPQQVAYDFRQRLGTYEQLEYFARLGAVELIELADGATFAANGFNVTPFRLFESYVYAFIIEGQGRRILIIMDELHGWEPPKNLGEFDLAVIPSGIFEIHPLSGTRTVTENHPIFASEATFEQTLAVVRKLNAKRVVLSHIEEPDFISYEAGLMLEGKLQSEGLPVTFAYDGLKLEV